MKNHLATLLLSVVVLHISAQNTLNHAFSIGGTGSEYNGRSITDPSGGNIVYGGFNSTSIDVDPGPAQQNLVSMGGEDGVIVKYDTGGNYVWSIHLGASGAQRVNDVCIEPNSIDVCGYFQDTVDFDPGPGVSNLIGSSTGFTGFVARYDHNGALIWAQAIGGWSQANGIAVTWAGTIAVVGHFGGTIDSDPGPGTATLTTQGGHDCFYVELAVTTGAFVRSLSWGSNAVDRAYDVTRMGSDIVICGAFSDTCDFDPGATNSMTVPGGVQDGFVLSLDANLQFNWVHAAGTALDEFVSLSEHPWAQTVAAASRSGLYVFDITGNTTWSHPMLGIGNNNFVTHHPNGDVILAGATASTVDFDPGAGYALLHGGIQSFWAAYSYSTGAYQYVKAIKGGTGIAGIGFTPDNRINVSGIFTDSAEFDLSVNNYYLYGSAPASPDMFVAQYSGCSTTTVVQDINLCAGDTLIMDGLHFVSVEFSPGFPQLTCIELNQTYTSVETFSWVGTPATGCDTAYTYTVNAQPALSSQQTLVLCGGDSVVVGPFVHYTSGTYVDAIPSSSGCDSIVTTVLTVNTVDTSLTVSWSTLYSNAVGATYQWIDCSTGQPIAGATSFSYTATANGEYACVITQNNCTDTSSCYTLVDVSVSENSLSNFMLYPNPAHDFITVSAPGVIQNVRIIDLAGRTVLNIAVNSNQSLISIGSLAPGTYVIEVSNQQGIARKMMTRE